MANKKELIGDPMYADNKAYGTDRIGMDGKPVKRLIIEGTAIVTDIPGINGRAYPREIIAREVDRLNKEWVPFGRLGAELNHPRLDAKSEPRDFPIFEQNLWKTCALIEELRMDGNKLYCRMCVIDDDVGPGHKLKRLIESGYVPGYSLRGAGNVIEGADYDTIADDYSLITVDVVGNPSFGDKSTVSSHYEGAGYGRKKATVRSLTESVERARREFVLNRRVREGYGRYNTEALIEAIRSTAL